MVNLHRVVNAVARALITHLQFGYLAGYGILTQDTSPSYALFEVDFRHYDFGQVEIIEFKRPLSHTSASGNSGK